MVTLNDPRQSDAAAVPQFAVASPREVQQWVTSGQAVIIDVREPDEYAREHIAGARLMPLSRLDSRQVATVAKPGQRVVVHRVASAGAPAPPGWVGRRRENSAPETSD